MTFISIYFCKIVKNVTVLEKMTKNNNIKDINACIKESKNHLVVELW